MFSFRPSSPFGSFQAWKAYLVELEETFDPSFSYAHGPTPMYSLSKALLNAYTRLSHGTVPGVRRVVAVCPGNFESPMTTAEEREGGPLATADAAAADVWALVADPDRYPGGRFYRHREQITW